MSRFEGHIRRGHTIVFGLLALIAAVDGAISTWLATKYHQHHNQLSNAVRDRTRLIAFTSWFTLLFSLIFLLLFLHSAHGGSILVSVGAHAIFLGLIWVLWTAGAASITAALGGGINCSYVIATHVPGQMIDFNLWSTEK
ncbi:hypothetical protein FRC02_008124 [Tulasnella sp. 418]|nr:hypothetical protein FRC02_008124 [Tulasnella sp. 418]